MDDDTDDIDIVEHDILDDPQLRHLFQDLFSVKQELDYFEHGLQVRVSIESLHSDECDQDSSIAIKSEPTDDFEKTSYETENFASSETKPDVEQTSLFELEYNRDVDLLEFENIEILSSLTRSKVVLLDSSPYLEGNQNYCANCTILFANNECFNAHLIKYHKTNEVNERPVVQILMYQCTICTLYLRSPSSYAIHMKRKHNKAEVITPQAITFSPWCKFCSKSFKNYHAYQIHVSVAHREMVNESCTDSDKASTSKKIIGDVRRAEHNLMYKCEICTMYLSSPVRYANHMKNKHNKTNLITPRAVTVTPWCTFCSRQFTNHSKYKVHLYVKHADMVNKGRRNKNDKTEVALHENKNYSKKNSTSLTANNKFFNDSDKITTYQTFKRKVQRVKCKMSQDNSFYKCEICTWYSITPSGYALHMYRKHNKTNVITPQVVNFSPTCKFCSKISREYKSHNCHIYATHAKAMNDNTKRKVRRVKRKMSKHNSFYKCEICTVYSITPLGYALHMNRKHNKTNVITPQVVNFSPTCKFCSKISREYKSHNCHIYATHAEAMNDNSKQKKYESKDDMEVCNANLKGNENNSANRTILISNKESFDVHIIKNDAGFKKVTSGRESNYDAREDSPDLNLMYKCEICTTFLISPHEYDMHMNRNHALTNVVTPQAVIFTPWCKFCRIKLDDYSSYNSHIYGVHADLVNELHKPTNDASQFVPEDSETLFNDSDKITTYQTFKRKVQRVKCKMSQDNSFYKCEICTWYSITPSGYALHMYRKHNKTNVITPQVVNFSPTCKFCSKISREYKSHNCHIYATHAKAMNDNTKRKVRRVKRKMSKHNSFYKCEICTVYSITPLAYALHMNRKHNKTNVITPQVVNFSPTCKFCSKISREYKSHNCHIYATHAEAMNDNSKQKKYESKDDMEVCNANLKGNENNSANRTILISNKESFDVHIIKNDAGFKKVTSSRESNYDAREDSPDLNLMYKCEICTTFLISPHEYDMHMNRNHALTNVVTPQAVIFTPWCKFCRIKLDDYSSYNSHIYGVHADLVNELHKPTNDASQFVPEDSETLFNDSDKITTYQTFKRKVQRVKCKMSQDNSFYKCEICTWYSITPSGYALHMYRKHNKTNVITPQVVNFSPTCKFCSKISREYKSHNCHIYATHAKAMNDNTKRKVRRVKRKMSKHNSFYKCEICTVYSITPLAYALHMNRKHNKTNVITPQVVNFSPTCKFCSKISREYKSHNCHIYATHAEAMNDNSKQKKYESKDDMEVCNANLKGNENNSANRTILISNKESFDVHIIKNDAGFKKVTSSRESNYDAREDSPDLNLMYKCEICTTFLISPHEYDMHMNRNHALTNVVTPQAVIFTPWCKFCRIKLDDYSSYNSHIYGVHADLVNELHKPTNDASQFVPEDSETFSEENQHGRANSSILIFNKECFDDDTGNDSRTDEVTVSKKINCNVREISPEINQTDHVCSFCGKRYKNRILYKLHLMDSHDVIRSGTLEKIPTKSSQRTKSYQSIEGKGIVKKKKWPSHKTIFSISPLGSTPDPNEQEKQLLHSDDCTRGPKYYKCPVCEMSFFKPKSYKCHMYSNHKIANSPLTKIVSFNPICIFCGHISNTADSYKAHVRYVHKDIVNAKVAELNNEALRKAEEHITLQRTNGEQAFDYEIDKSIKFFKCHVCEMYLTNTQIYRRHLKCMHFITDLPMLEKVDFDPICGHCGKNCTGWHSYLIHLSVAHYEIVQKKNNSEISETSYDLETNRVQQQIPDHDYHSIQTDIKRYFYKCAVCGMYTYTKTGMGRHMLRMHDDMYIPMSQKVLFDPVCEFCGKRTTSLTSHNHHLTTKHSDFLHKTVTNISGKTEETEKNKALYMGTKNTYYEKFYKCHICAIFFITYRGYAKHAIKNHGMTKVPVTQKVNFNPYCDFCSKRFVSRNSYLIHVTESHKDLLNKKVNNKNNVGQENNLIRNDKHGTEETKNLSKYDTVQSKNEGKSYDITCSKSELSSQSQFYRCDICWCYYDASIILESHLEYIHGLLKPSKFLRTVKFDPKCKFCPQRNDTIHTYNEHLMLNHQNVLSVPGTSNNFSEQMSINDGLTQQAAEISTFKPEIEIKFDDKKQFKSHTFFKDIIFKCVQCDIHFLSAETASEHTEHIELLKNWECPICNKIFKKEHCELHKRQHIYSLEVKVYEVGPTLYPRILFKCPHCRIHYNESRYFNHLHCSKEEQNAVHCKACNILIGNEILNTHNLDHIDKKLQPNDFLIIEVHLLYTSETDTLRMQEYTLEKNKDLYQNASIVEKPSSSKSPTQNVSNKLSKLTKRIALMDPETCIFGLLYTCISCGITVDSYDKVVDHCQRHYSVDELHIDVFVCKICNLKMDKTCQISHEQNHANYENSRISYTILNFDYLYLASHNSIWIKHVFGKVSQKHVQNILHNSIYRYECRVKLHVTQNGPPDLTLYKCDSCQTFVDVNSLFKHAENACFKLRKHPCSFCGINFISSDACSKHEIIHVTRPNVDESVYRIVLFNKKQDKELNYLLTQRANLYVLYQCRNCCGVVDKPQRALHKCNRHNLNKCDECNLLFFAGDLDLHYKRHTELPRFSEKNMKIILFGEDSQTINTKMTELSSKGNDYTLFCCIDCNLSTKHYANISKHKCVGKSKMQLCFKCKSYFTTPEFKTHLKYHTEDLDFIRENIRIVTFSLATNPVNGVANIQLTRSGDKTIQLAGSSLCDEDNRVD